VTQSMIRMTRKIWVMACVFVLVGVGHLAAAQYMRVGVDGSIPLGKLDDMEDMLGLADGGQRADLLERLGVEPAIAKYAIEEWMPGEKIALHAIRTIGTARYGIAFVPSGVGVSCYLYLLQGSDEDPVKTPWHVVDHQELNCWHGPSSFEIMSLRRRDTDDVVLHHVNEGHGSGYVADQTQVFSVVGGKLVQTLATEDFLMQVTLGTEDELDQTGTFVRFPDLSLEETRSSSMNDKLRKIERRYWRWSAQERKFVAGRFAVVSAPISAN